MIRYILRRVALMVPLWIGISLLAFLLAQFAPGDPARMTAQALLGRPPTPEEVAAERERLGLDRPWPVRFGAWVADAARGDLGVSYETGEPIRDAVAQRFPRTLQLALLATGISLAVAIPLGVLSAIHRDSPLDHAARALSLAGASMPSYWLGYLLILVFAVKLHWFAVAGAGTWRHAVLPAVTLALGAAATLIRMTRSEMLEALGQEHVAVARAKGLPERAVLHGHVLRNALLPMLTLAGLQFGGLLGGAVIVETVFNWPGMGRLAVDAIGARDYPMIQAFVVLAGTSFLVINLVVDLLYTWSDPRIRLAGP